MILIYTGMDTQVENVNESGDNEATNTQFCVIEASVVTGFEECARGEAKEKFGTDVKAARGKITWKVPIDKVNEVSQDCLMSIKFLKDRMLLCR